MSSGLVSTQCRAPGHQKAHQLRGNLRPPPLTRPNFRLSDSERGVAERLGTEVATRGDRGGLDVAVEAAPEGHPSGSVPGWGRAGLRTGVLAGCRDDTDLGSTSLRTLTDFRDRRGP